MSLWSLFKGTPDKPRYRQSVNHIVEGDQRFECTIEYANQGYEEGWLTLTHYWIGLDNVEHCEYQYVPPA